MNASPAEPEFGPRARRATVAVKIGEGGSAVEVGGGAPIVVQSMTNTDTADVEAQLGRSPRWPAPARRWFA